MYCGVIAPTCGSSQRSRTCGRMIEASVSGAAGSPVAFDVFSRESSPLPKSPKRRGAASSFCFER